MFLKFTIIKFFTGLQQLFRDDNVSTLTYALLYTKFSKND